MAFAAPDLGGLANLAVRALQHQVRQTVSSIASEATPSPTTTSAPLSNTPTSATASSTPTTDTGNTGGNSGGSGGGGGSSPLLFFVALGFGVVFTNLW